MLKDTQLAIRLPATAKARLQEAADRDHRTLSSMTAKIILDWLAAQAKQRPTADA